MLSFLDRKPRDNGVARAQMAGICCNLSRIGRVALIFADQTLDMGERK
jgi:hypothetical protein